jgi:molybdopterin converting factor small subunit
LDTHEKTARNADEEFRYEVGENAVTPRSIDETPRPPKAPAANPNEAELEVQVLMFGMVSAMTGERQVTLRLPAGAVVSDVIAALAERYKAALFEDVMSAAQKKTSHCRISVNGRLAWDLMAPLGTEGGNTTVEIILLSAYEGR